VVEQHAMIQVLVNPRAHGAFDVSEIDEHATIVKMVAGDTDDRTAVMAMEMAALAIVVEKPMAVAKINFAGDMKHKVIPRMVDEADPGNVLSVKTSVAGRLIALTPVGLSGNL
jgi:hypothetical protein